jgi:hypothetical protein
LANGGSLDVYFGLSGSRQRPAQDEKEDLGEFAKAKENH